MTFDDDALFLETPSGKRIVPCRALQMEWPPPERLTVGEVTYIRTGFSSITDEERERMTNVMRGASYEPELNS